MEVLTKVPRYDRSSSLADAFVCWSLETIPLSDNSWENCSPVFLHNGENNSISLVAYPPLAARNPVMALASFSSSPTPTIRT